MTPEEFRRAGYAMIDWIAAYRESIGDRPVLAPAAPGEIKAMLPSAPPQERRADRRDPARFRCGRAARHHQLAASALHGVLPGEF